MTALLFPAPDWPTLPVAGTEGRFPVRRVFCVGRNYADHAAEMGHAVDRAAPFYFTKSALAVTPADPEATVPYPPGTADYHHEVELVIALGAPAFRVAQERAADAIFGYAVGLDMTRRDLQAQAKDKGRPWSLGKDVEGSAVIGRLSPARGAAPEGSARISLTLDGDLRQQGRLGDMVWSIPELIADLSRFYHLQPGDLIMTGTPAGVGPVSPGMRLRAEVEGLAPLTLTIGAPD